MQGPCHRARLSPVSVGTPEGAPGSLRPVALPKITGINNMGHEVAWHIPAGLPYTRVRRIFVCSLYLLRLLEFLRVAGQCYPVD